MVQILSILSGLMALVVYWTYYKQVRANHSTPNPSTWAIWVIVMVINAFTYHEVLQENPIKGTLAYVTVLCMIAMFTYSLAKGKLTRLTKFDAVIFLFSSSIGVFWQLTGDAFKAQLALQVILLISFFPTIAGLLTKKAKEKPKPWVIAVGAYILSITSILWEWNGNWIELAYPIVNGIIGNGTIALIAIKQSLNYQK